MAYCHLTLDDREYIEYIHGLGYSQAYIARILGVHRSTISSELKRNSYMGKYDAWIAHELSQDRKKRPSGYLLRRRSPKRRTFYRPPYRNTSWFDRENRFRKEDQRPRTGRKKKEWRVVRHEAYQLSRKQVDKRFRRGTHAKARKKQPKGFVLPYPASLFRTYSLFRAYYPSYLRNRKRKNKVDLSRQRETAWCRNSFVERNSTKTASQSSCKRPLKKAVPLPAGPVLVAETPPEVGTVLKSIAPQPGQLRWQVRKSMSRSVNRPSVRAILCTKTGRSLPEPVPP